MMKITLLGTGATEPCLERQCSGYLIEVGDDRLIMDHGQGAYHRLLETGCAVTDITHVFLSHLHYDHMMDYPALVLQRWDMGADRIPDLAVYGPAPLARITRQLFGEQGVFDPDITSRTDHPAGIDDFVARGGTPPRSRPDPHVGEITAGDVIEGEGWRLTVGTASHFQPQLECLGFRLESRGATLCYSGDNGGVQPEMIELARDADVLIHMLQLPSDAAPSQASREASGSHIDVAETARAAGVKKLVLTHISAAIDIEATRARLLDEMQAIYRGEIVWGEDLMTLAIE